MKGRPFVIYKVKGDIVYLFSIRPNNVFSAKEFYYPITLNSDSGNLNKCYVNLRYIYAIDKDVLIQKVNTLKSDLGFCSNIKKLSTKYRKGLLKGIDKLCFVEEYKKTISQVESGELYLNMFV